MRTKRKLVLVFLVAALTVAAPASPVHAAAPLRSGSIISGTGDSPAFAFDPGFWGCEGAPSCAAWLQSKCSPALAGKNPAVHASIVGVAKLADGVTQRVLQVQGGVGINWGRVIVQFWTATDLSTGDYCEEILPSRVGEWHQRSRFPIPDGVRWMTITPSPDNTQLKWRLW